MNRTVSTIVASIISCLITLFVVQRWSVPQATYRAPLSRPLRRVPQPYSYYRPPPSVPSRPYFPKIQRSVDCSSDFTACGEGSYCCLGQCVRAVYIRLEFVADDRGDLYVCQQTQYNRVAHTDKFDQVGSITGWFPCYATYLTARNEHLGGATIYMRNESTGVEGASGTSSLPIDSEPDFNTMFNPVVRFTALYNTFPYSDYINNHGAYPVTDAENSSASNISFRFMPIGC